MSHQGLQPWQSASRFAVGVLSLHLIFEYLRLHEILPILNQIKLQTVVLAVLLIIVIAETARRMFLTRQSWFLLAFLGLTVFTILPATQQYYAYRFAYGLFLTLIGYFAITHILRNERDLKRFLSLLVGIHMFLAVKGIIGYSGSRFRSVVTRTSSYSYTEYGLYTSTGQVGGSFLADTNDLALAMIVILPFAMYLFRQSRSLPARIFWGAGSVAILLTIIFTFSRGGFLGLTAMALYWAVTTRNKAKAICTLVLGGALVIAVAPPEYWERIETIGDTSSGTAQVRRGNWTAARRMFYESPVWGVGGNNFSVRLPEYALEYPEEMRIRRWGRAAHSMYFTLLAEFGLLGILLIGSILFLNFRDLMWVISLSQEGGCRPAIGQLAHSVRLSFVGFLIPATFLSVLGYPHMYYLTALTVVVHRLAALESGQMEIDAVGVPESAG